MTISKTMTTMTGITKPAIDRSGQFLAVLFANVNDRFGHIAVGLTQRSLSTAMLDIAPSIRSSADFDSATGNQILRIRFFNA